MERSIPSACATSLPSGLRPRAVLHTAYVDISKGRADVHPRRVRGAVSWPCIHGQKFRRVGRGSRIREIVGHYSVGLDVGNEVRPTHKESLVGFVPCQRCPNRCSHCGVSQWQVKEVVVALRDLAEHINLTGRGREAVSETYVSAYVVTLITSARVKEIRIDMGRTTK